MCKRSVSLSVMEVAVGKEISVRDVSNLGIYPDDFDEVLEAIKSGLESKKIQYILEE